jgi:hypothetical protein
MESEERRIATEIWAQLEGSNALMNMARMYYPCVMFYMHVALFADDRGKKEYAGFLKSQLDRLKAELPNMDHENIWQRLKEIEANEAEKILNPPFDENIVNTMLGRTPAIYSMLGVFLPNMSALQKVGFFYAIITGIIHLLEGSCQVNVSPVINPQDREDPYRNPHPFELFAERLGFKFSKSNISFCIPRDVSHLLLEVAGVRPGMEVCFPFVEHGTFWADLFVLAKKNEPCLFHLFEESSMYTTANLLTCLPGSWYTEIAAFINAERYSDENPGLHKFLRKHGRFDENFVATLHREEKPMAFDRVIIPFPTSTSWYADMRGVDLENSFLRLVDWPEDHSKKNEWLYILAGMDHVRQKRGRVIALLPNNALYRRGFEERIRSYCVKQIFLDVVIALPKNIFPSTDVQTYILVFDLAHNKRHLTMESILFVDATKQYAPTKNINRIEPGHIEFILQALGSGDCPDSDTCFRVPRKEIVRNKANLTLGFYASARGKNMSDPEDLTEIKSSIRQLNQDLSEALDENRRVVESMLHER